MDPVVDLLQLILTARWQTPAANRVSPLLHLPDHGRKIDLSGSRSTDVDAGQFLLAPFLDHGGEDLGVSEVNASVDLADRFLGSCRVFVFDDTLERSFLPEDETAKSGRVRYDKGEYCQGRVQRFFGTDHLGDGRSRDQRQVTVDDESA